MRRASYQRLRALLLVGLIAIVGLTTAVVVLAISNTATTSSAGYRTVSAVSAPASAETGARLDHQGRKSIATHG